MQEEYLQALLVAINTVAYHCKFYICFRVKTGKKMATIVLLLIATLTAAVWGDSLCLIDNCSVCNSTFAICKTHDANMPIPNNLNPNIITLYIGYSGPPTVLKADMLSRYQNIHNFSITGNNITEVKSGFFASQKLLRVSVQYTSIQSLPNDTFGENSNIYALFLGYNKLMSSIPTNVFHSLRQLILIDLSYNINIQTCRDGRDSIGEEFRNLTELDILHIAGLGMGYEQSCVNVTPSYFEPVSQIRQLNLSDTGFFYSKHASKMLTHLTNLTILSLNHVSPYTKCPASAQDLFNNLNQNLVLLQARRWRTTFEVNESCILTNKTLYGLKQLPNLKILDFKYSDQIFGNVLRKSVIHGFNNLTNLELSWCRLTRIEDGALIGFRQLKTLNLEGNQLASREFWVYGKNNSNPYSYPLWAVELQHCGIDSDETFTYNAYYLLRSFPNLTILDLSRNQMFTLPLFKETVKPLTPSNITWLDFSVNQLKHLSGDGVKEMCAVMPNLKIFRANDNVIVDIGGLETCKELEELHIMINQLSTSIYLKNNLNTIKKLHKLTYLDLTENGLDSIPSDLFQGMVNLTTLYLANNKLTTFDRNMLSQNPHLSLIDFSVNKIQVFNTSLLKSNPALTQLWISDNLIEILNESFVDFVERKAKNLVNIRVDGNPFDCTCGKLYFQRWVNATKKLVDAKKIECDTPALFRYNPVYNYTESFYICQVQLPLEIFCTIAAVIALSILISVSSYRYRWYIRHARVVFRAMSDRAKDMKTEDECDYDVMICLNENSDHDLNWVKDDLLVNIEGGRYNSMNFDEPDDRVSGMMENQHYLKI